MGLKKPIKTGPVFPSLDELSAVDATPVEAGGYVVLDTVPGQACTMESNTPISIKAELGKFGDATAADVVSGKTFTGAAGLFKTGTYVAPTLASMTADATATAGDIASGKTAYVNGSKVTGEGKMDTTKVVNTFSPSGSSFDVTISYDNYLRITDKWNHVYLFSGHMAYYATHDFVSNIIVWKEAATNSSVTFQILYSYRNTNNFTVKITINGNSNPLRSYISKIEEISL